MKSIKLDQFYNWMQNHSTLSEATLGKYKRAVNTVSNDMLYENVISKSLVDMSVAELDCAISIILNNEKFIIKNKTGNNMYSCGLKQFRLFALDTIDERDAKVAEIINDIKKNPSISVTEKESLINSRIGQGYFRKLLLEKYEGRCVITGIDISKVLVASHIIPWSVSDNENRLSVNNGILLSATYDRLFDSGLITFKNNGQIVPSRFISKENKIKLGLENFIDINLKATSEMLHNLEYHRDVVFVK